ncbi:MAG: hypothetical protein QM756_11595 [Polyangiaceae bacterium]
MQSIYVYADELKDPAQKAIKNKQGGTVTFVTKSGSKHAVRLIRVWFPAGTWAVEIGGPLGIKSFKPLFPPDVPQSVIDSLNQHTGAKDPLLSWQQKPEDAKILKRMVEGSVGTTIRVVVSYSKGSGGNAQSLPDKLPLTAADISPLTDPALALMYLQFVEHFGGTRPDFRLAEGGLTRAELDLVEQNRPDLIAITDLFLQGFGEFNQAKDAPTPPAGLTEFQAMEEAIFFQRKVKNALALRNMLQIGMGSLLFTTENGDKDLRDDIGVLRRTVNGGSRLLLYDRFGNAVRGIIGGFIDTEFRSTNLEKANRDLGIPLLQIEVSDQGLYLFLRGLEQELGHPVREIEALAASLYKYAVFITIEIHRRYNGEIGKRLIAAAPVVVGFFVAHAFAAYLVRVQPLVGVPFMLLVKGAGMLLGFDALLLDMELLAQAGRHFTQMEQLHREAGDTKPALTKLSEGHLKAGAAALLDAMADFIALGVILAGGFAAARFGPAMIEGIKNKAKARSKVTIDKDQMVQIDPVDAMKEVKTPIPKAEDEAAGLNTPEQPEATGQKPVDHPDAYKGEPQKGKQPPQPGFEPNRPKALDQTPDQFEADKVAQQELFDRAKEAVARQNAFIQKILADLGIKDADAQSILKRNDAKDFAQKIIDKIKGRKSYKTVSQMTDIIRGRINLENPADVQRVKNAITQQREVSLQGVKEPLKRLGVKDGYPRVHIDVVDPETGIAHEWQIGTKQTTELFERPGIDPAGVKIEKANTNIHDIEYDIFKSIDEPNEKLPPAEQEALTQLSQELDLRAFRKRVAEFAARTGREKVPQAELDQAIKDFHEQASAIMRALVDKKGTEFVEDFLH